MNFRAFLAFALLAAGCRAAPDPAPRPGYVGIDQVQILAKGME
jgi:hypothetical protein